MNEQVSVIIPIYNTEKYLRSCIDSILAQTWNNIQIILVNDGSKDNSAAICDEYAAKYSNIQVIHKENEGLGYTRNCGMKYATGDYLSFLDSDDSLDENTYEECIRLMKSNEADVCYFGRKTFDQNGTYTVNENVPEKLVYKDEEVGAEFAKHYFGWLQNEQKKPFIKESACCVLYSRRVISENEIQFPSERECLSEDAFFNLDVCRHSKCIIINPQNYYNYRYNEKSLTTKYDAQKFRKAVGYYHKLNEYISVFPEIIDAKERIDYKFLALTRGIIKREIEESKFVNVKQVCGIINYIINVPEFAEVCKTVNTKRIDKNTKIFISWARNKRTLFLYFFYKIRKVIL